jgi:WD40 repeat protein
VRSGRTLAAILHGPHPSIAGHFYSDDSRTLRVVAYAGSELEIMECDVATGRVSTPAVIVTANGTIQYLGAVIGRDGRRLRLVVGSSDGSELIEFEWASGQLSSRHPFSASWSWSRSPLVLSSDGRLLGVAPGHEAGVPKYSSDVVIWDVEDDREVGRLRGPMGATSVTDLACSSDWTTLALRRDGGSIEVWDLRTKRLRLSLEGHQAGFRSHGLRLAPDGATLASVGFAGSPALSPASLNFHFRRMAGGWIGNRRAGMYEASADTVVWDTRTGRCLERGLRERAMLFSPSGRALATTDGGQIKVRDIPGKP